MADGAFGLGSVELDAPSPWLAWLVWRPAPPPAELFLEGRPQPAAREATRDLGTADAIWLEVARALVEAR